MAVVAAFFKSHGWRVRSDSTDRPSPPTATAADALSGNAGAFDTAAKVIVNATGPATSPGGAAIDDGMPDDWELLAKSLEFLGRPADIANLPATRKLPRLHWPIMWTIVVTALIVWGMHARLERYITPQRGIGYWLGIIGGSMMLLLLMYSARKRVSWLRWIGGITAWFEFHMVLGVVGPVLILFHSNFSLGGTNSNMALICMLVVACSGVVGRYIYTRLHAHMDGNEDTLEQLKAVGSRLRTQTTSIAFLPGLLDAIDRVEGQFITPPKGSIARFLHLFSGPYRMARARWALRQEIKHAVSTALMRDSPLIAKHAHRIAEVARRYADRRLEAGRRISEYKRYARLFSFWHVLHIPLFFMLLIAGVVHVIAVNVY